MPKFGPEQWEGRHTICCQELMTQDLEIESGQARL